MRHGHDPDSVGKIDKVDDKRKSLHHEFSDFLVSLNQPKPLRVFSDLGDSQLNLRIKLGAQSENPFLIKNDRVAKLDLGLG